MKLAGSSVDFLRSIRDAETKVGAPEHKTFASEMNDWRGDMSFMDFNDKLTEILKEAFFNRQPPVPTDLAISVIRDMVPFSVGSAWWAHLGFPSIALTHDFQRSIAVTDFGDAGEDPIHMPFDAFVLRLPESLRGRDFSTPMFIYPVPVRRIVDDVPDHLSYRMTIAPEPDFETQEFTQWDKGVSFREFLGDKVRRVEDVNEIERNVTAALGREMDPEVTKRARRVLGNTLLYIDAGGGLPTVKRVGAALPVEREHGTQPRFRVGRPITLGPQLRDAIREGLRGGVSWKLQSKFVVRGHWRNQAHGPGMTLRKRIPIHPYWKGPENIGEALERRFEVK